jgi:O-antigen/teichoic acid export membrane protein
MKIIESLSILRSKLLFKQSQRSRKVIVNASNSLFVKAFSIVANFYLIALSIDCVNSENYGLWLTITSVITWMGIFDFGLVSSLKNKIAEALAFQNFSLGRKYVSTTYTILLIIIVPVWIVFLFINSSINWQSIFNTSTSKEVLEKVLLCVFTGFCLQFLLKPISSILAGDQKHFIDSFLVLIGNASSIAVILLFRNYIRGSIYQLSIILVIMPSLVTLVATFILFTTKYKGLSPSIRHIDFGYRKELLGVGFKFFIIQFAGLIMFSSNNFIISHLIGNEEVTSFNIAFRYFSILTIMYSLINAPIWTAYSEAYAVGDWAWIKKATYQANLLCTLLLLLTLIMLLFSSWVYKIWVNDSVHVPFTLSALMAINVVVSIFASTYTAFINGTGRIKLQTIFSVFTGIVHIPLAYLLVKVLGLGLNGLVILTILWTLISLILWRIQYKKIVGQSNHVIWT